MKLPRRKMPSLWLERDGASRVSPRTALRRLLDGRPQPETSQRIRRPPPFALAIDVALDDELSPFASRCSAAQDNADDTPGPAQRVLTARRRGSCTSLPPCGSGPGKVSTEVDQ